MLSVAHAQDLSTDSWIVQALERRTAAAAADFKAAHIAETLWGFGTLRHVPAPATLALLLQGVLASEVRMRPPCSSHLALFGQTKQSHIQTLRENVSEAPDACQLLHTDPPICSLQCCWASY